MRIKYWQKFLKTLLGCHRRIKSINQNRDADFRYSNIFGSSTQFPRVGQKHVLPPLWTPMKVVHRIS